MRGVRIRRLGVIPPSVQPTRISFSDYTIEALLSTSNEPVQLKVPSTYDLDSQELCRGCEIPPPDFICRHSNRNWQRSFAGYSLTLPNRVVLELRMSEQGYREVYICRNGRAVRDSVWRNMVDALDAADKLVPPGTVMDIQEVWIYKRTVFTVDAEPGLTEEEIHLRIKDYFFAKEREIKQLRKTVEVYERVGSAEIQSRERISDSVRMFVWERDRGQCVRCGCRERLEFDHIIPVVEGGSSTERNIQLLCEPCNRKKGKRI